MFFISISYMYVKVFVIIIESVVLDVSTAPLEYVFFSATTD